VKDLETMVAALQLIRLEHPTAVLAIAGDGPSRPALEAAAAARGVRDAVRLLAIDRMCGRCCPRSTCT